MSQEVITFEVEKDTRNTRRFQEVTDGKPAKIGPLYVQKWYLEALAGGNLPERVKVTVEVG